MEQSDHLESALEDKAELVLDRSVICGRCERLLAFLTDLAILLLIGFLLDRFLHDYLLLLGGFARFVGFLIAVAYFGFFGSYYSLGQTIGKKFVGLMVVGVDGRPLSSQHSFVRSLILCIPYFLTGAPFGSWVQGSPVNILVVVSTLGLGGVMVYLFLFNRGTGQSLHDIIIDSYVIRSSRLSKINVGSVWAGHIVVVMLWITLVCVFAAASVFTVFPYGIDPEMVRLESLIDDTGKMEQVSVFTGKRWREPVFFYSMNRYPDLHRLKLAVYRKCDVRLSMIFGGRRLSRFSEANYCYVNGIIEYKPGDPMGELKEMARTVLENYSDAMMMNSITVSVSHGYDMGIYNSYVTNTANYTPKRWEEMIFDGK